VHGYTGKQRVHSLNNVPDQPRNLDNSCVLLGTYLRYNRPKFNKTAQNRRKLPHTEPRTSGITRVRTWLGTLLKECTRTSHGMRIGPAADIQGIAGYQMDHALHHLSRTLQPAAAPGYGRLLHSILLLLLLRRCCRRRLCPGNYTRSLLSSTWALIKG
jgi:hypothetical protein